MKLPSFSKQTPQQRRADTAKRLAEAESEAAAAQMQRLEIALRGEDTSPAEERSWKLSQRVQTLAAALVELDREIAAAEIAESERQRKARHDKAASVIAAQIAEIKDTRAGLTGLLNDARRHIAFHDAAAVGYANRLLAPSAGLFDAVQATLDEAHSTLERAIVSLQRGDGFADDLAGRALASKTQ